MPTYQYKHPKTGKIFECIRTFSERDKPLISDDGEKCEFVPWYLTDIKFQMGIINRNAEVWEKDSDYVKKVHPKYVKYRDGHREKFDPTRHC
jgi:hypothetical protein